MLLGGGELQDEIITQAKQKDVYNDIIFVGIVPNVFDYEQAFDVFILPSLHEGLPLSIIEAQVSGLPCITSKGLVSTECSVTDLVTYLPINQGAGVWADKIQDIAAIERHDRLQDVAEAGYDAATSAKDLQEFYINKYQAL
jgi:glycosyltransferase involved in cell wall biosynthesis